MALFLAKRIIGLLLSLLVVSVLLFATLNFIPGKASSAALGTNPSPEAIAAFDARYGLDQPLHRQYLVWLGGIVQGDFGRSLQTDVAIGGEVARRIPVTLQLTGLSILVALTFAVPLALLATRYRGGPVDMAANAVSFAGLSLPAFASGTALVLVFSLQLRWLPPGGYHPFFDDPVQSLRLMAMPALALGLVSGGVMMRILRAGLANAAAKDFATVSRSRGASRGRVLIRHAVPVAAVPFMSFGVMELSAIFSGAVVIERIFQLPGLGSLVLQSVEARDFRTLQAAALVIAAFVMIANLLVDLAAAAIDPRLRRLATS